MHFIMDTFSKACTAFGLTISLKKTKLMYAHPAGEAYVEPVILLDGKKLGMVDNFIYLGSKLSKDSSLDTEITTKITKVFAPRKKQSIAFEFATSSCHHLERPNKSCDILNVRRAVGKSLTVSGKLPLNKPRVNRKSWKNQN